MQQTTDTATGCQKTHIDEECINFQSSPNFKHNMYKVWMQKYLKSKFDEDNENVTTGAIECVNMTSPNHVDTANQTPTTTQPPLPPNSPPPDDVPTIVLKKEIEDDEYRSDYNSDNQTEQLITQYKTDEPETSDRGQETMCRNFIRGTCKRGASCIFVHKLILSQLPGVYTFCKNFQNSVCTHAKCKFVHATVFEKEYFFRTGYLPPHTMSHLKESNVLQPPPPPPPEETQQVVPPVFSFPPPIHPGVTPMPVLSRAPTPSLEARTDVFRDVLSARTSPLKREWSDSDDFSCSPRDLDSSELLAKKCKNCDSNEFRFQYNKDKVKKMMRISEEMEHKISQINKKRNKLYTVFAALLKPLKSSNNGTSSLNTTLNIGGEKDKILDQLNLLLSTNNRFSIITEENNKNIISNNFSNFLAKHLNGDPSLSPDVA